MKATQTCAWFFLLAFSVNPAYAQATTNKIDQQKTEAAQQNARAMGAATTQMRLGIGGASQGSASSAVSASSRSTKVSVPTVSGRINPPVVRR